MLAIEEDFSLVRRIEAVEHVHQGTLTCAVFTQDGMDGLFTYIQVNAVKRLERAKHFRNAMHLDGIFRVSFHEPPPFPSRFTTKGPKRAPWL